MRLHSKNVGAAGASASQESVESRKSASPDPRDSGSDADADSSDDDSLAEGAAGDGPLLPDLTREDLLSLDESALARFPVDVQQQLLRELQTAKNAEFMEKRRKWGKSSLQLPEAADMKEVNRFSTGQLGRFLEKSELNKKIRGVRQSINDNYRKAHAPDFMAHDKVDASAIGRIATEEGRFYYMGSREGVLAPVSQAVDEDVIIVEEPKPDDDDVVVSRVDCFRIHRYGLCYFFVVMSRVLVLERLCCGCAVSFSLGCGCGLCVDVERGAVFAQHRRCHAPFHPNPE